MSEQILKAEVGKIQDDKQAQSTPQVQGYTNASGEAFKQLGSTLASIGNKAHEIDLSRKATEKKILEEEMKNQKAMQKKALKYEVMSMVDDHYTESSINSTNFLENPSTRGALERKWFDETINSIEMNENLDDLQKSELSHYVNTKKNTDYKNFYEEEVKHIKNKNSKTFATQTINAEQSMYNNASMKSLGDLKPSIDNYNNIIDDRVEGGFLTVEQGESEKRRVLPKILEAFTYNTLEETKSRYSLDSIESIKKYSEELQGLKDSMFTDGKLNNRFSNATGMDDTSDVKFAKSLDNAIKEAQAEAKRMENQIKTAEEYSHIEMKADPLKVDIDQHNGVPLNAQNYSSRRKNIMNNALGVTNIENQLPVEEALKEMEKRGIKTSVYTNTELNTTLPNDYKNTNGNLRAMIMLRGEEEMARLPFGVSDYELAGFSEDHTVASGYKMDENLFNASLKADVETDKLINTLNIGYNHEVPTNFVNTVANMSGANDWVGKNIRIQNVQDNINGFNSLYSKTGNKIQQTVWNKRVNAVVMGDFMSNIGEETRDEYINSDKLDRAEMIEEYYDNRENQDRLTSSLAQAVTMEAGGNRVSRVTGGMVFSKPDDDRDVQEYITDARRMDVFVKKEDGTFLPISNSRYGNISAMNQENVEDDIMITYKNQQVYTIDENGNHIKLSQSAIDNARKNLKEGNNSGVVVEQANNMIGISNVAEKIKVSQMENE